MSMEPLYRRQMCGNCVSYIPCAHGLGSCCYNAPGLGGLPEVESTDRCDDFKMDLDRFEIAVRESCGG